MARNTLQPNTDPIDKPKEWGLKDTLYVGGATTGALLTGLAVWPAALSAAVVGPAVWGLREHFLNKQNRGVARAAIKVATENASVATRNHAARPAVAAAKNAASFAEIKQDAAEQAGDAANGKRRKTTVRSRGMVLDARSKRDTARNSQAVAEQERNDALAAQANSDAILLSDIISSSGIRVPSGGTINSAVVTDELAHRQAEMTRLEADLNRTMQENTDLQRQLSAAQVSASASPRATAASSGPASQADLDQARDDLVDAHEEMQNLQDELDAAMAENAKLAAAGSGKSPMDHYINDLAQLVTSEKIRARLFAALAKSLEDGTGTAVLINAIENVKK